MTGRTKIVTNGRDSVTITYKPDRFDWTLQYVIGAEADVLRIEATTEAYGKAQETALGIRATDKANVLIVEAV